MGHAGLYGLLSGSYKLPNLQATLAFYNTWAPPALIPPMKLLAPLKMRDKIWGLVPCWHGDKAGRDRDTPYVETDMYATKTPNEIVCS